MDFIDALNIATGVFDQYKIDQLKWWKKMDGTPILNDVAVRMAMEFVHAWNDEEVARSAFEMQHVLKNGDLYDSEPAQAKWNASADEYNQWDSLGKDEKDELIALERKPAQVSQPVFMGWACWLDGAAKTLDNCQFSKYEPLAYPMREKLYSSPDYEALKDENEALKLRVAELEENKAKTKAEVLKYVEEVESALRKAKGQAK